ncbi:MAG: polyprenyl synthetase family protein [Planctomycetes bacterium]|nr:polyprenyl synthetase family protein [Planctomycetota bacterium]
MSTAFETSLTVANATYLPSLESNARDLVAAEMDGVESRIDGVLSSRPERLRGIIDHVSQYRGKRFRPLLALLVARTSGPVKSAHIDLAAAIELMHTASLVHDDILDNADTRRHVPAIHSRWGHQAAVLLGDYLFSHAFELTASVGDARLNREVAMTARKVCQGEIHQSLEAGNWNISEAAYQDMIEGKTAEMIAASARLAAMICGRTEAECLWFDSYGRNLGMAFQIADDLIDLEGQEGRAGKSLGTDLDQGKATLPLIHALTNSKGTDREELVRILGSGGDRAGLRRQLEKSGSITFARDKARDHVSQAKRAISFLPPSPYRQALLGSAEKALARDC